MPEELDYYIEQIKNNCQDIIFIRDTVYNKLCEAGDYLIQNKPIFAGQPLKDAAYYLWGIFPDIATYHPPSEPFYYLPYVLEELAKREITWQSICEAWVANDFEARFWTIGIIDRMRQIMWDEPFDLTWAARPEEKEIV